MDSVKIEYNEFNTPYKYVIRFPPELADDLIEGKCQEFGVTLCIKGYSIKLDTGFNYIFNHVIAFNDLNKGELMVKWFNSVLLIHRLVS